MLKDCIIFLIALYSFLIWEAWILFQSRALLKMDPSSPSMEEFCTDIQK